MVYNNPSYYRSSPYYPLQPDPFGFENNSDFHYSIFSPNHNYINSIDIFNPPTLNSPVSGGNDFFQNIFASVMMFDPALTSNYNPIPDYNYTPLFSIPYNPFSALPPTWYQPSYTNMPFDNYFYPPVITNPTPSFPNNNPVLSAINYQGPEATLLKTALEELYAKSPTLRSYMNEIVSDNPNGYVVRSETLPGNTVGWGWVGSEQNDGWNIRVDTGLGDKVYSVLVHEILHNAGFDHGDLHNAAIDQILREAGKT